MALPFLVGSIQSLRGMAPMPEAGWGLDPQRMTSQQRKSLASPVGRSTLGHPTGSNSPSFQIPTHRGKCVGAGQHTGTPTKRSPMPPPLLCLQHPVQLGRH